MARNRIIYQSEALYVSETGATATGDILQLHRVQSANYSFDVSRQDVNQFGQLAAIDRIIVESPTVSLDFSYYCETGLNENKIGLTVGKFNVATASVGANILTNGVSCISGILQGTDTSDLAAANGDVDQGRALSKRRDISNYFIATYSEGNDAAGNTAAGQVGTIAIGNGFITSYSANGSVGDFVTADVSVEGLNMVFDGNGGVCPNPAVTESDGTFATTDTVTIPRALAGTGDAHTNGGTEFTSTADADIPTVLRHGDILLSGTSNAMTLGHEINGASNAASFAHHAQNYTFSFDLSRIDLEKLGSRFAYTKEMDFPLSASVDVSFIVGEIDSGHTDSSESIVSKFTTAGQDASFNYLVMNQGVGQSVGTSTTSINDGLAFAIKGAKTDSQGYSSSIGDAKTMDISCSSQIGGPEDTANGILIAHLTDVADADPHHVI